MARIHRYASDLTDAEWKEIEPLLPPPSKDGRNEAHPRREIVDEMPGAGDQDDHGRIRRWCYQRCHPYRDAEP